MLDFLMLAQQCAPSVHPQTMAAVAQVESGGNPFAIGVVGGHLDRQPRTLEEAVTTARWLEGNGFNYSVGLAQVNKTNFARYGLTVETAFDSCPNLRAGGSILTECFLRARKNQPGSEQDALRAAFSCYYSGNFVTGFRQGYVSKVVGSRGADVAIKVPQISPAGAVAATPKVQRSGTTRRTASSESSSDKPSASNSESALIF